MKGMRGWILLGAAAVGIAIAVYVGQPHQDSPEHSSNSDAANGTSAALLFSQAVGHPTSQIVDSFSLPDPNGGLMFVFTPTSPYAADDADRTLSWVRSGGVLIYASEQGDPELDRAFGVTRSSVSETVAADIANPVLDGVSQVAGAGDVMPLETSANQVAVLRDSAGSTVAYVQHIDSGTVVVLADPLVLCNGYLGKLDNGRLLSDLLGVSSATAPVVFDEYHHGLILSSLGAQPWVTTAWGAALLWLLVAVFVGLILRGRSFGPVIARPVEAARADVEWAAAVGQLLRRSSARAVTLGLLATATERTVAARTGLPLHPRERFWNALWVRSPALAADLAEAEVALQASAASEAELLKAAQRLHHIAHPVSEGRRQRRTTSTKETS
jgi:hypothetical protein